MTNNEIKKIYIDIKDNWAYAVENGYLIGIDIEDNKGLIEIDDDDSWVHVDDLTAITDPKGLINKINIALGTSFNVYNYINEKDPQKDRVIDGLEDMGVASLEYDGFGDENSKTSDWSLLNEHATFSHSEACEFIIYVGSDECQKTWEMVGYSQKLIDLGIKAQKDGFKYLCLFC